MLNEMQKVVEVTAAFRLESVKETPAACWLFFEGANASGFNLALTVSGGLAAWQVGFASWKAERQPQPDTAEQEQMSVNAEVEQRFEEFEKKMCGMELAVTELAKIGSRLPQTVKDYADRDAWGQHNRYWSNTRHQNEGFGWHSSPPSSRPKR